MKHQYLHQKFGEVSAPKWYTNSVSYLRGGQDSGMYGLYIYNLVKQNDDIRTIVDIGTARGHSATCAAKGLEESGRSGEVHTIDVIPSKEDRYWGKKSQSDPVANKRISAESLISKIHQVSTKKAPIIFHTGESNDVLKRININPDLVFHDGLHTYSAVKNDIQSSNNMGEQLPIHVFDDCHVYSDRWRYRPFMSSMWRSLDSIPKFGGLIRRCRMLSIQITYAYPGVTEAVSELIESKTCKAVEVISDNNHAPITTVYQ